MKNKKKRMIPIIMQNPTIEITITIIMIDVVWDELFFEWSFSADWVIDVDAVEVDVGVTEIEVDIVEEDVNVVVIKFGVYPSTALRRPALLHPPIT